jgi:hypothetical protein
VHDTAACPSPELGACDAGAEEFTFVLSLRAPPPERSSRRDRVGQPSAGRLGQVSDHRRVKSGRVRRAGGQPQPVLLDGPGLAAAPSSARSWLPAWVVQGEGYDDRAKDREHRLQGWNPIQATSAASKAISPTPRTPKERGHASGCAIAITGNRKPPPTKVARSRPGTRQSANGVPMSTLGSARSSEPSGTAARSAPPARAAAPIPSSKTARTRASVSDRGVLGGLPASKGLAFNAFVTSPGCAARVPGIQGRRSRSCGRIQLTCERQPRLPRHHHAPLRP